MEAKKRRGLYVPHDIREEILMKVPVKSLVRFKAVSKEWRGTIESKCFVEKHTNYQKREARIVRVVSCFGRRIRKSISLENLSFNGIVRSCPYRRIRPLRLPPHGFKISEPCDGLFCIYTKDCELNLVNPATNSRRILPDPSTDVVAQEDGWIKDYYLLGIGRENSVSPTRYKLVWFYENKEGWKILCTRCKVFALDSNTWNQVDAPNCRVYYDEPVVHLDGVVYCLSFDMEEKNIINKLVLAFDLHTETFKRYSVPPEIETGSTYKWKLSMCVLNHRLCMFSNSTPDINERFFKIWGLDINKRSWEIRYSIEFSCFPQFADKIIIPVATLDDYVILRDFCRTIWVLYGSKTCRTLCSSSSFASKYFMSFFETLVSVQ